MAKHEAVISGGRFNDLRRFFSKTAPAMALGVGMSRANLLNLATGRSPVARLHALAALGLTLFNEFPSDEEIRAEWDRRIPDYESAEPAGPIKVGRGAVLLAKIETTPGVDSVPTGIVASLKPAAVVTITAKPATKKKIAAVIKRNEKAVRRAVKKAIRKARRPGDPKLPSAKERKRWGKAAAALRKEEAAKDRRAKKRERTRAKKARRLG